MNRNINGCLCVSTPIGIICRDALTGKNISGKFTVQAQNPLNRNEVKRAFVTNSGIYAFSEDIYKWGDKTIISVYDTESFYLPFRCTLEYLKTKAEPSKSNSGLFCVCSLYASSTSSVATTSAIIRTHLYDPVAKCPASWARLAIIIGSHKINGYSNKNGEAVVVFPYPEPLIDHFGSPVNTTLQLFNSSWPFTVSAWYNPSLADLDALDIPMADQAAPAKLYAKWNGSRRIFKGSTLLYGKETIVESSDSLDSYLFIIPTVNRQS